MKFLRLPIAASAAFFALSLQPAFAHRFWIVPSSTVLSGENPWVTVDAAISNSLFFPDHAAPDLSAFSVVSPSGKPVAIQNGSKGKYRSTFDVELNEPGTYRIGTVRDTISVSYEENGETKRERGTEQTLDLAALKTKPGFTMSRNHSRVETFVTSGEPTPIKPTGKGLELVMDKTHPNDLFSGEPVTFFLHLDGKPAAKCEVTFVKGDDRYRSEPGEVKVITDESGKFELNIPEAGRYWLTASAGAAGRGGPPQGGGESNRPVRAEGAQRVEGGPRAEGGPRGNGGPGGPVSGTPAGDRSSYTATFEVLPQ